MEWCTITNESGTIVFKYNQMCEETFPCQHGVKCDQINTTNLAGDKIYNFLNKNNMPIPDHFMIYGCHHNNE